VGQEWGHDGTDTPGDAPMTDLSGSRALGGAGDAAGTRTHLLSKSTYMRGHQCAKQLSLYTHRRELMPPVSPAQQAIFDAGTEVGLLAQGLFPGGVDLRPDSPRDFRTSLARTARALADGAPVLYEAAVVHDDVLAAVDILVRDGDQWCAYEVKSTGRVKPQHVTDAALQYHVLTSSGVALRDISIVHLNPRYVRRGALLLPELFRVTSVHHEVVQHVETVPALIAVLKGLVRSSDEPVVAIGRHCDAPYECPFKVHCWEGVHTPTRGDFHVDVPAIRGFLDGLRYPLYYMDFETFSTPVPLLDGTSPYGQVPFQFSVHRQEAPDAPVTHAAFLAEGQGDPREPFLHALLEAVGDEGEILAYHLPFESQRLAELAALFPASRARLEAMIARCKDLIIPFKRGWYYHPAMGTSNSIKAVLPALVPELTYDGMAIGNGADASRLFLELHTGRYAGDVALLREQLQAYCHLDTLAMVRILGVLEAASRVG
jgi:hypothetical protein